jgi:hypothetical protein
MAQNGVFNDAPAAGMSWAGLLHLTIGYLAIRIALGSRGETADQTSALAALAAKPGGVVALWVAAAAFLVNPCALAVSPRSPHGKMVRRQTKNPAPDEGTGPSGERLVLLSLLASLAGLRCAAGALGFGFLLRGVTLRISLVLLGLPFALNVVATRDGTDNFLGLTFNAFNDALDGFFWSAVVLPHMPTLPLCVGRWRTVRTKVWVSPQLLPPNSTRP